jgi:pyruvate/2-oxoglutarate dehydrogenase complex dihydrolipoamide acyltransferase (E2) component
VVDGAVVPRFIMPFSHSMDHRIIDGAQEMAFMRQVIGDLEHPARLML